jgi:hypothetical protein
VRREFKAHLKAWYPSQGVDILICLPCSISNRVKKGDAWEGTKMATLLMYTLARLFSLSNIHRRFVETNAVHPEDTERSLGHN